MTVLFKLLAFLKRDWEVARSYKIAFMVQFGTILLPLAGLYFMGRLFNQVDIPRIDRYGGNYVSFVLVGIIITSYSGTALRAFSSSLRGAQVNGTLEVLLLTKTNLATVMLGWAVYPFLRATINMVVYLIGGFLLLGLRFGDANILSAVIAVSLMVVVMGSLGILAASFTLVFKQGDPMTRALVIASGMLSGTLYPVGVLPEWLQAIARLLPQTHAIEAIRIAILRNGSVIDLAPQLGALLVFAALLVPVSLFAFSAAMNRARIEGSLAHY